MDINRANLTALFETFAVRYKDAYNTAVPKRLLEQIAMTIPSTTKATVHAWLNQIPGIREWIGDRVINNIQSDIQTVENKKFEGTIEMPREDIEDDQYGLYMPLADSLGMRMGEWPDVLIANELTGDVNWGGDKAKFFGTTRAYGANTISNKVTSALAAGTFETAITTMQSYLGHKDQPLNVTPFALLVGPSNRVNAFNLCQNDYSAFVAKDATTYIQGQNPNKGMVLPVVSNRLVGTYASYWFLLGQVGTIRGAVYQERMAPEIQTARTSNESDFVFENDKYQFGVRSRGAAFLTFPHLIYAGIV